MKPHFMPKWPRGAQAIAASCTLEININKFRYSQRITRLEVNFEAWRLVSCLFSPHVVLGVTGIFRLSGIILFFSDAKFLSVIFLLDVIIIKFICTTNFIFCANFNTREFVGPSRFHTFSKQHTEIDINTEAFSFKKLFVVF